MRFLLSSLLLSLASFSSFAACQQDGSEILDLPGAPTPLGFRQFSGYYNVTNSQRRLFYWFVESQSSTPSSDPLILWQTGGPGCSSISALLSENGPFYPAADSKTLLLNDYAWNKAANVLYFESPANVGWSYSPALKDRTAGDERTAADLVDTVQQFLMDWPQLQKVPLWLTGESYGGHYVPNLALAMTKANAAGQKPPINIKGFLVGNAWTVAPLDNAGAPQMWWSHSIIPNDVYNSINANCDFANIGPLALTQSNRVSENEGANPAVCNQYLNQANELMSGVDIYNLYADVCLQDQQQEEDDIQQQRQLQHRRHHTRARRSARHQGEQLMRYLADLPSPAFSVFANATSSLIPSSSHRQHGKNKNNNNNKHTRRNHPLSALPAPVPDPCITDYMTNYMNLPAVQAALHVTPHSVDPASPKSWSQCSYTLDYSRTDLLSSMMPVYDELLTTTDLSITVYSGDIDGIVPVTGTRKWLDASNYTISKPWYTWTDSAGQTGGWVQEYTTAKATTSLRFVTVRHAGHMVPMDQPARASDLLDRTLNGQPL